jgi:hypothetical protein
MNQNGKKLIYLACPYSHADPKVRKDRFNLVTMITAKLIQNGIWVYSPITMCHPIVIKFPNIPFDIDYWKEYDSYMVSICDEVWVAMLDNWRESKGVTFEIKYGTSLNKPIKYIELVGKKDFLIVPDIFLK